jgi:hypothetical protein
VISGGDASEAERISFVCECGRERCTEVVEATLGDENVRSNPKRFLVVSGHEHTDTARVVERTRGFCVVEKLGEAGEVAVERDPR